MADPPAVSDNPFRIRAFVQLWMSRMTSVLALQLLGTAIGWQVYTTARDGGASVNSAALSVGMIGLAQFLPMVLFTLPAGEMADRRDRRAIVMTCLVIDAVCAAALVALDLRGSPPFWSLVALSVILGATRAYISPASSALLPMLTPREVLPRAITLNSLGFQGAVIVGPSVAGLLVLKNNQYWVNYASAFVLFLCAASAMALIRERTKPDPTTGSRIELIKEGLAYTWRNKIVFGAISLDLVAVLLGGATALMPAFAFDVLHVGPKELGWMRSAPGVGALLMAAYLSKFHIRRRGGLWMFLAVAVFGVATVVFGLSQSLWLSLVALVILGAADMISVNVRSTLIQLSTPDAMRGRVSSVSMLFISASNELGEFESGIVARFLGPIGAAVFGGVGSLMATGLWAWWFPSIRKADRLS